MLLRPTIYTQLPQLAKILTEKDPTIPCFSAIMDYNSYVQFLFLIVRGQYKQTCKVITTQFQVEIPLSTALY